MRVGIADFVGKFPEPRLMKRRMKKKSSLPAPPYKDPTLPVEKRVRDLLARMTLPEKAAQMTCIWQEKSAKLQDANGDFDPPKAQKHFGHGCGIGQIARPSDAGSKPTDAGVGKSPRQSAELTNAIQKFFKQHSRLGIPVLFHEECLHGHAAIGATSFCQPIGLAATFNPNLVQALYAMAAEETRARGAHQALTPVVDVARDPRWGRVEETFGEDPYLVAQMGLAAVRGFQGDATFQHKKHVLATLKHFAAHGQPESGLNCAPANISERSASWPATMRLTACRPTPAAGFFGRCSAANGVSRGSSFRIITRFGNWVFARTHTAILWRGIKRRRARWPSKPV
jgi:beta-glucosidase